MAGKSHRLGFEQQCCCWCRRWFDAIAFACFVLFLFLHFPFAWFRLCFPLNLPFVGHFFFAIFVTLSLPFVSFVHHSLVSWLSHIQSSAWKLVWVWQFSSCLTFICFFFLYSFSCCSLAFLPIKCVSFTAAKINFSKAAVFHLLQSPFGPANCRLFCLINFLVTD